MKYVVQAPISWIFLHLLLLAVSCHFAVSELTFDVGRNISLQLSPGILVENSPGSRPGDSLSCLRVHIHCLSRISNISMFAHSVKLKVLSKPGALKLNKFEVCFHRNASVADCMCPQSQWEKVGMGLWSHRISPFDNKLSDLRVVGSSLEGFVVEDEEEFFPYRIVLLVLGLVLLTLAPLLSNSLVFYYSSAMAVGVILLILMVLFQGMRLLPTCRRNSVAIFLYSSVIGLGSFLLCYVPGLIRSLLVEMGISEEMYNPVSWLGFWVVRKLVLTEDGLVDPSASYFVAWVLQILAAVMILQCSLDPIVSAEALLLGIALSWLLRKPARLNIMLGDRKYVSSIGLFSCPGNVTAGNLPSQPRLRIRNCDHAASTILLNMKEAGWQCFFHPQDSECLLSRQIPKHFTLLSIQHPRGDISRTTSGENSPRTSRKDLWKILYHPPISANGRGLMRTESPWLL